MIPHFICDFIYLWGSLLLRLPDDEETGILAILNRRLRSLCKLPLTIENVEAVDDDDKLAKLAGKPYIPNFTKAFEHFCVHAGGRGVLDAIEKNLQLPQEKLNASRHTLYNYGNTSSSSIWYEMKYHCERSNIRKGDRIWQIAFGSGFKWYVLSITFSLIFIFIVLNSFSLATRLFGNLSARFLLNFLNLHLINNNISL